MTQPLNRAIELHDSTLSGVSQVGSSVVLQFSAAYVHESAGKPGVDAGSGWYQPATFTVTGARLQSSVAIPATLDDGFLRCDTALHRNGIPLGAPFHGAIELSLTTAAGETFVVQGDTLTIELFGEPRIQLEELKS